MQTHHTHQHHTHLIVTKKHEQGCDALQIHLCSTQMQGKDSGEVEGHEREKPKHVLASSSMIYGAFVMISLEEGSYWLAEIWSMDVNLPTAMLAGQNACAGCPGCRGSLPHVTLYAVSTQTHASLSLEAYLLRAFGSCSHRR